VAVVELGIVVEEDGALPKVLHGYSRSQVEHRSLLLASGIKEGFKLFHDTFSLSSVRSCQYDPLGKQLLVELRDVVFELPGGRVVLDADGRGDSGPLTGLHGLG